jgi:hypothetical protein
VRTDDHGLFVVTVRFTRESRSARFPSRFWPFGFQALEELSQTTRTKGHPIMVSVKVNCEELSTATELLADPANHFAAAKTCADSESSFLTDGIAL